jgi:hypothetical protein
MIFINNKKIFKLIKIVIIYLRADSKNNNKNIHKLSKIFKKV